MNSKFGQYLKEKRQERKITLRGMARELGISAAYLSNIEKGKRNPPSVDRLNQISKVLSFDYWEEQTLRKLAGKNFVPHISARELCHRLCNGFNTRYGHVVDENGEPHFVDLWVDNGVDTTSPEFLKFFDIVVEIIESIPTVDAVETEYHDYNPNDYDMDE